MEDERCVDGTFLVLVQKKKIEFIIKAHKRMNKEVYHSHEIN